MSPPRPAIAALDDAREATAALLLPLDPRRWARLALLAFLVGGGGGVPAVQGSVDPGVPAVDPNVPAGGTPPAVQHALPTPSSVVGIVVALLAVALLLGLAYAVAGAVAEFVLVVAVRDGRARLRVPAGDHLGRGLRLFGFRLAVWLVALVLVGVPAALVIGGAAAGPTALLALGVPVALLGLLVLLAAWLVLRLTTDFVVPTMVVARSTPTRGWRRLWPTLRDAPVDAGLYLVVRVALGVVAGIATGLVAGVAAVAVAVPFAVAGLVGYVALGPSLGTVGIVALGLVAVAYLLVALVVWLLVRVPVVVYLRAFALAALGRLDPGLDLLGVTDADGDRGSDGGAGAAG